MPDKSVRDMNKFEKLHYSLASRTFHAALRAAIILGLVALLVGLGLYGFSLTNQYISEAFDLAKSTGSIAAKVVDPAEIAAKTMDVYYEAIEAGAEPGTDGYYALFSEIENDPDYRQLISILKDFNDSSEVNDVYFAMYDDDGGRIVIIADPDDGATECSRIGDFEPVSAKEIKKFLNWDGSGKLYHISHTKSYGWLSTSGVPCRGENGETAGFFLCDTTLGNLIKSIRMFLLQYTLIMCLAVVVVAVVLATKMKKKLAEPINKIADAAVEYARDKQNGVTNTEHFASLDIRTGDEIESLSLVMKDIERDLSDYEENLTRITAEKERLGTELALATRIQADMLPNIYPAFPDRPEFDVFATMTPAKEVGGDFYDFFLIDDDHLGIVMADVSGKGVPAALFMMASRIMIRNTALTGRSPKEVLETVNDQICANNREEMFVTAWLGVLEISTGRIRAVNAGHEFPVVGRSGVFDLYKDKHGFVIGGIQGVKYTEYELQLDPGDMLFLYTDGVPEATDADHGLFGTVRMLSALNSVKTGRTTDVLEAVSAAVDAFVDGSPQFDDMTMLCLKYNGGGDGKMTGSAAEITVSATVDNIGKVTDFVNGELDKLDCPIKAKMQLDVAIDEIFSNVAKFAYGHEPGKATVAVDRADDPSGVTVTFYDSGKRFDPLSVKDPDVSLGAEEREIGGLGLFIVRKTMDDVKYEYKDGMNVLTVRKNFG